MTSSTGSRACACQAMYTGHYCDANLWPLLVIPIVIFILVIILLIVYLYRRGSTTPPLPPPSPSAPSSTSPPPKNSKPPPKNTFFLPAGKPLAVGFNDTTLKSAGAPRVSGAPPPNLLNMNTMCESEDPYYDAVGPNMALAFNDYTFAPATRTTASVLFQSLGYEEPAYSHALGRTLAITLDRKN